MAKADLEMALVKAQGRSPLTADEMLELLGIDVGTLLTEHGMDLYQAEEVLMWRKHEALRWTAQLTSFPEPIQESKKLSVRALNKMILGGKKRVIKESPAGSSQMMSVEEFAHTHGLSLEYDQEGQKIIYVDMAGAASIRTDRSGARVAGDENWSTERDNSGQMVIYTGEYT